MYSSRCNSCATALFDRSWHKVLTGGQTGGYKADSVPVSPAALPLPPDSASRPLAVAQRPARDATPPRRDSAPGGSCGRRTAGAASHSRSPWPVVSPDQGDQPGVGIANDPLQPAARTDPCQGEPRGEGLDTRHRSSWLPAAGSLPQILDKIRGANDHTKSHAGGGGEEGAALSCTHSTRGEPKKLNGLFSLHTSHGDRSLGLESHVTGGNGHWL